MNVSQETMHPSVGANTIVASPDPHLDRPIEDDRCPLVVDVDGTLIRTDLLHESAMQFVARQPLRLWQLPVWLLRGRACLKQRLSEGAEIDPFTVPLHEETVTLVRTAQQEGRSVFLATAAHRDLIEPLAVRLGGVAGIFASDGTINLAGATKADRLVEHFGIGGFDYIGNARVDFPVWRAARRVLAVASSPAIERRVCGSFGHAEIIARPRRRAIEYVRALRPHQWMKNLLIFVPTITSHKADPQSLSMVCLAFLAFCFAASSTYLLNDMLDLQSDRAHPRKRSRPFASGRLPILHGWAMAALLSGSAAALAALASPKLLAILGLYVTASLTYSLALKRQLIVDVIALSGLYTLRVFAGASVIAIAISPWLLMFSLFLFLCLALVKRCSELALNRDRGLTDVAGRAYRTSDLAALTALAAAAGVGSVLVFTLYLSSPEVLRLYATPLRLWLAAPVLLAWISRTVILANRGEIHDDPVVFALTDRFSQGSGIAMIAIVLAAL